MPQPQPSRMELIDTLKSAVELMADHWADTSALYWLGKAEDTLAQLRRLLQDIAQRRQAQVSADAEVRRLGMGE
jgi:hypothetical protein